MITRAYFTDDSLLRHVVGDRMTALSGPRALLVMAAHPVAFAGFFAHTGALDDPYAGIRRQYGFSWDPVRSVALHGGAEYVRRVLVPVLPERFRTIRVARAA